MSQTQYHRLQKRNPPEGPREMRVGSRVYVSHEAAAAWRQNRENGMDDSMKDKSRQNEDESQRGSIQMDAEIKFSLQQLNEKIDSIMRLLAGGNVAASDGS
jgi:hypothetical protein